MQLLEASHPEFPVLRDAMIMAHGGLLSPGHSVYYQAYFGHEFEECSFALVRGQSRLLVLITRHWEQERPCYSWYGRPIQQLDQLSPGDRAQSEGVAVKQVQKLLAGGGRLDYQCLSAEVDWFARLLLSQGGQPRPVIEQSISLQSDVELLAGLRKAYRQNLRWGEEHLNCRLIGADNVTPDDFAAFEAFHIQVAGRRTRSSASWLAQLELVRQGENFLVMTDYEGRLVGVSLFAAFGLNAYYSVGVYDRELFALPISHYPVWLGLLQARQLGCRVMAMGESYYPNIVDSSGRVPSEKECRISHFKRGFGGHLVMGLRFIFECAHSH